MSLILIHRAEGESVKSVEYRQEPLKVNKDYFESWEAGIKIVSMPSNMPVERLLPQSAGYASVMYWVRYWADYYDYPDVKKAEAIISCEGGFEISTACNGIYGCAGGQGHFQFIPSTWANMQKAIGVKNVFDTSDNVQAGIYLLKTSGDQHWGLPKTKENPDGSWWGSRRCWTPKL